MMRHRKIAHKIVLCKMSLKKTCEFSSEDCYFTHTTNTLANPVKIVENRTHQADEHIQGFWETQSNLAPPSKVSTNLPFPSQSEWIQMKKQPHAPKPNDGEVPIKNTKEKKNFPRKVKEALMLPVCMNLNPRSIYNKVQEFVTFVKEKQVHVVFLSESWERPEFNLSQLLQIEDFTVISNPSQRQEVGGRPALVINSKLYHVRNLTNNLINIPWGCEATWALLTPKNVSSASKIQKIALCSLYCKPNSRTKTKLLDHISVAYNIISAKYQTGLHFIIAGDTNELKLDQILNLHPRMEQMVKGVTRLDPPRMLDPILTTLGSYYQTPEILAPLGADSDRVGRPSDHLIPLMRPINQIDNKCSRTYREIRVRPVTRSGMERMGDWFEAQEWTQVITEDSINKKAEGLISMITEALNKYIPEKVIKVASDDEPWYSEKLKKLDRRRRREYNRSRRSPKYLELNRLYQEKLSRTKKKYKRDQIDDLKAAKSGQWYSQLKRITRYDQGKEEIIQVEEISSLSDQDQAEMIADHLAQISQTYEEVRASDIDIPLFDIKDIPQLTVTEVKEYI